MLYSTFSACFEKNILPVNFLLTLVQTHSVAGAYPTTIRWRRSTAWTVHQPIAEPHHASLNNIKGALTRFDRQEEVFESCARPVTV